MKYTYEDVYKIASDYSEDVMRRYGLPTNKFSAEDVAGEFMVKFMSKGFLEKYNPAITSFKYYVYRGMGNTAIDMVRRVKREITSRDALFPENDPTPAPDGVDYTDDLEVRLLIEAVKDFKFGYAETTVHDGVIYESTVVSVLRLLVLGFRKPQIAERFKVSVSTIDNALRKVRAQLRELDI